MPSSAILDVAIGIAFVYLFLSLICSVVNEGIAAVFSLRAKNLVQGVNSLFSGSAVTEGHLFVDALYQHGLIRGLFSVPPAINAALQTNLQDAAVAAKEVTVATKALAGVEDEVKRAVPALQLHIPSVLTVIEKKMKVSLPSYIPSRTFATALIDIISPPDASRARVLDDVRAGIQKLPPSATQQALLSLVAETQTDLSEFQQKVENWFNDSMDRAAGWYKRRAQNILLVIALGVTVLLNVDTIKLAQSLWNNPVARQATVDLAQKYVTENKSPLQSNADLKTQADQLASLGQQLPFPFGWQSKPPMQPLFWLETLTGWFITTLALSLGAPFWFDTLNKFMVVRSTVKPQEKSQTDKSKD